MSKLEFIVKKQSASILEAYEADTLAPKGLSAQAIVKMLASASYKYLQWTTNQYCNKFFKLEDINRIKNVLTDFSQKANKDINNYNLHSLEDYLDSLSPIVSKRQEAISIKQNGSEIVHQDDECTILWIKTEEAAKYYGKGTKWCTAGDQYNAFDEYNEEGNIYILLHKDRKYQFHFETESFMDEKDKKAIEEMIKIKGFVNFLEDKVKAIAALAVWYAKDVIKGPWPPGEEAISKIYLYSYLYAKDVIKGPWPPGESVIAKNAKYSYYYAKDVIKGQWPSGEEVIAKDTWYSYYYARDVIKVQWPSGEEAIAKGDLCSYNYAIDVIRGPWPPGEKAIANDLSCKEKYEKLWSIKL